MHTSTNIVNPNHQRQIRTTAQALAYDVVVVNTKSMTVTAIPYTNLTAELAGTRVKGMKYLKSHIPTVVPHATLRTNDQVQFLYAADVQQQQLTPASIPL
jgi:hypothetical protein